MGGERYVLFDLVVLDLGDVGGVLGEGLEAALLRADDDDLDGVPIDSVLLEFAVPNFLYEMFVLLNALLLLLGRVSDALNGVLDPYDLK